MDVWKQFEENNLTHSAAHHLLAVLELRQDRGYARVTDVARFLNITTGSASTNLKNLKQKGLVVEDDNKFLALSETGESFAKAVIARKEIFRTFLHDVLKVSSEQAEIDACKTEHLLSHETSQKLLSFLQILNNQQPQKHKSKSKLSETHKTALCPVESGSQGDLEACSICNDHCLLNDC